METILISSATTILVAVIAGLGTWLVARKPQSVDANEMLRKALIEEINRLKGRVSELEANEVRLNKRVDELELENLRLFRQIRLSGNE